MPWSKAKRATYMRRWDRNQPMDQREKDLKRRFGLSLGEYDDLIQKQQGGCAICGGKDQTGRRLSVDHDHSTDQVRGLLCGNCNRALGAFQDNPVLIERAARYLRSFRKR